MNTPENGVSASVSTGSAVATGNGPDNGQPVDLTQYVPKKDYDALFERLGKQGEELGDARKTLEEVDPLMQILGRNPETVRAIMAGKVDDQLAKAVISGEITLKQAEAVVAEAVETVKNDMGEQQFNAASQPDIAKLVENAVNNVLGEKLKSVDSKLDELSSTVSTAGLESEIRDFIAQTPDIGEYTDAIQEYLDANPDLKNSVRSVEMAYWAVKGRALEEAQQKALEAAQAEEEKKAALNAGGGSPGQFNIGNEPLIGGGSVNPNRWAGG